MAQRPVAIGLSLCEQVIVEAGTGNVTPVNCFTHRSVKACPSEKIPFVVFSELTDGAGQMTLDVMHHRLDTFDEILKVTHAVTVKNQLHITRLIARTRCSFPVAGQYQVSLLADGEIVAQRKLRIVEKHI